MLPRVGAALANFIKPITSSQDSQNGTKSVRKRPEEFQRFRQGEKDRQQEHPGEPPRSKPGLKLVPREQAEGTVPPGTMFTPISAQPGVPSVASAFLQIFSFLSRKRSYLLRWIGKQAYSSSILRQKKTGKFKKGAILDRQAD